MVESFQLDLPEPDPEEEPLELEGELKPPRPVELPPWLKDQKEQKLPAGQWADLPPEPAPPADPDALWEADQARADQELVRFTLAELMLFTLLLSVLLTLARFVSLPALAGLLGAAVLIGVVLLSTTRGSRAVYFCWITLLVSYVLIVVWAALRSV